MLKKPLNEMIKGHKHVEDLRKQRGRQPARVFMTQRSKRLLSVRGQSHGDKTRVALVTRACSQKTVFRLFRL